MTDAELILAARAGDTSALDVLYRRYLPTVWRYAFAQLRGDTDAAEDVVSETFLAAVRQLGDLRPAGGGIGGWLIAIARHKVGDVRRRIVRHPVIDAACDVADRDESADPAWRLDTAELRAGVADLLDRMPDEQRLALEWKYIDGLSVRDIAERLGRTEKAAETILYRARNAFRDAWHRFQRKDKKST